MSNRAFSRMKFFSKLRNLFAHVGHPGVDDDLELDWLYPPEDPNDVSAWDRYWVDQIENGLGPPLFDMFCDDRMLVAVMKARKVRRVLCAGNGISQEPKALAEAGFEVTALDNSREAIEIARSFEFPPHAFQRYCDPGSRRSGGCVEFVLGDFREATVCPGPFDVVIERRTAQLFSTGKPEQGAVLRALADRLGTTGIFVSHCHDGAWRPPAAPRHFTEWWFKKHGWTIWEGGGIPSSSSRFAWLMTTTG